MSLADKLTTIAENEPKVYEAGKQDGLAMFWNGITANGTRGSFAYSLGYYYFTEELLRYPITIQPTNATYMFQYAKGGVDLWESEKNGGVKFDFSRCSNFMHCLRNADFAKVGIIDGTNADNLDYICYNTSVANSFIKWVEKLIVKETHTLANAFNHNESLEHIIFEGTIGQSLDMIDCPLDVASAKSIMNCLKNYSGTESEFTRTVSLSGDVWTALNADSTPPSGDTWQDYVEGLGWLT